MFCLYVVYIEAPLCTFWVALYSMLIVQCPCAWLTGLLTSSSAQCHLAADSCSLTTRWQPSCLLDTRTTTTHVSGPRGGSWWDILSYIIHGTFYLYGQWPSQHGQTFCSLHCAIWYPVFHNVRGSVKRFQKSRLGGKRMSFSKSYPLFFAHERWERTYGTHVQFDNSNFVMKINREKRKLVK